MPRLKAMLDRGEGRNLQRGNKSTRERMHSIGMTFSNLIESGQVERFDEDLKLVFDLGIAEILRQGRQVQGNPGVNRVRGREGDRADDRTRERRRREAAERRR